MYLAIGLKDSITRLFKGERKESCWLEAHSDEGPGRRTARREPNRKMGIFSLLTTASLPSYDAIGLKIS